MSEAKKVYGVKETKEVFNLGFAIVEGLKKSLDDGFDIKDLGNLIVLFPAIGPAVSGIDQVPLELADLDEKDVAELLAHAAVKLGVAVGDPGLEKKVVACIKVVLVAVEALSVFEVIHA